MAEPTRRISPRAVGAVVLWIAGAALLAAFVLSNRSSVRIDFVFWTVETTLVWALLGAAALGFLLGAFRIRLSLRR